MIHFGSSLQKELNLDGMEQTPAKDSDAHILINNKQRREAELNIIRVLIMRCDELQLVPEQVRGAL